MLKDSVEFGQRKGSCLKEPYPGQATSRHRNGELQRALTSVQFTSRFYTQIPNSKIHELQYYFPPPLLCYACVLENISRISLLLFLLPAGSVHLPALMAGAFQSIDLHLMQDPTLTI
jgi:hypothetical protein